MEARNRSIEEWFANVRQGLVVLPRFQRFEAWDNLQVGAILENIMRRPALPVGSLLILEVGDPAPFVARPIAGAPNTKERATQHLLDGQQRLTALWRSLGGHYEDFTYFVQVLLPAGLDTPEVIAVRRSVKNGARHPLWCDDAKAVWSRQLMPVALLCPGKDGEQAMQAWVLEASSNDLSTYAAMSKVGNELRGRVANYQLPFLSLPQHTDPEVALDVFIKMNTMNTALSAFDVVVAQVEASAGTSLHDKVESLRALLPDLADFGEPGEIALQVGAVLLDRVPVRTTYLAPGFGADLMTVWTDVERGLRRALAFLAEERIFRAELLPVDPLLTLLAAFWASAPEGKDGEGKARTLARRVLWTGSFTERYQKTSATRTLADWRQLVAYRDKAGPLPEVLDPALTPLPEPEALRTAGWPKTKDRLARAVLAASLRLGGHDLADDTPFGKDQFKKREYHHLFPQAFLVKERVTRSDIFSALNCALVSWRTNRTISDKAPSIYIEDRAQEVEVPDAIVDYRLRTHGIPTEALRSDDFERFRTERATIIHQAMLALCKGEHAALPLAAIPAEVMPPAA